MFKTNKTLLVLIAFLVIVLAGLSAGFVLLFSGKILSERPYYVVYLQTGDMYFGKPGIFNSSSFSDVWFLQRNPQDDQNPVSLVKFKDTLWGPEDKIYLNEENIVWKAKLNKDSQVLSFIKNDQNRAAAPPSVAPTQQTPGIPASPQQ